MAGNGRCDICTCICRSLQNKSPDRHPSLEIMCTSFDTATNLTLQEQRHAQGVATLVVLQRLPLARAEVIVCIRRYGIVGIQGADTLCTCLSCTRLSRTRLSRACVNKCDVANEMNGLTGRVETMPACRDMRFSSPCTSRTASSWIRGLQSPGMGRKTQPPPTEVLRRGTAPTPNGRMRREEASRCVGRSRRTT